jgi:hypothetical protein
MAEMESKIGTFVMGFILIILGIILLGTTADVVFDATTLQQAGNETLTIGVNTGTTAQDDIISVANFNNITDDLTSELETNINWTKAGTITVNNATVFSGADYNITYNFEGDQYVAHGTARVLIGLITLFFALAILSMGLYVLSKTGLFELLK